MRCFRGLEGSLKGPHRRTSARPDEQTDKRKTRPADGQAQDPTSNTHRHTQTHRQIHTDTHRHTQTHRHTSEREREKEREREREREREKEREREIMREKAAKAFNGTFSRGV